MASKSNITTLIVNLPGSGATKAYELSADQLVKFEFDLSNAVFAGQGDDLVITVEGGGTVVLKGYMRLAEADSLPTFEMQDGEQMPGDFYLFAFSDEGPVLEEAIETAAGEQGGSSGAGEYGDDPGVLGDGLDALGGQGDAYAPHLIQSVESVDGGVLPSADEDGVPVQIVINPGFEGGEGVLGPVMDNIFFAQHGGLQPTYPVNTDYADHWRNEGDMWDGGFWIDNGPDGFGFIPMPQYMFGGSAPVSMVGGEGDGYYMQLDSTPFSRDTLSQSVAVQAGDEATISFTFSPMVVGGMTVIDPPYLGPPDGNGNHLYPGPDMSTNNFLVNLGEQEVAAISYGGLNEQDQHIWYVDMADGVTDASGSLLIEEGTGRHYFVNNGIHWSEQGDSRVWSDLSFALIAEADHAAIRFIEDVPEGGPIRWVTGLDGDMPYSNNDGMGAYLDNVSAYRTFDNVIYDESDFIMTRVENGEIKGLGDIFEYLADNLQPISGTDGDDAIFGDTPEADGTRAILDGEETGLGTIDVDVINGQGGDDAIYGGNGLNLLYGGDGDDFLVGGRGLNLLAGQDGDDYLRGGRGINILVGGEGDDIIESGEGHLGIFQHGGLFGDGDFDGDFEGDDLGELLAMFNSGNIIITGDDNDMIRLGDGADLIFVNRSVLGAGSNTITIENYNPIFDPEDFEPGDMDFFDTLELFHSDFFVLGEGVSIDQSTENAPRIDAEGNLLFHIISDDQSGDDAWVHIADVGNWYSSPPMSNVDLAEFNVLEGDLSPEADFVNYLIQQIIATNGDLGGLPV